MPSVTHTARVTGPIHYTGRNGRADTIPVGPCLIEQLGGQFVDVVWGQAGEESAVLAVKEVETAELVGNLVLLD